MSKARLCTQDQLSEALDKQNINCLLYGYTRKLRVSVDKDVGFDVKAVASFDKGSVISIYGGKIGLGPYVSTNHITKDVEEAFTLTANGYQLYGF